MKIDWKYIATTPGYVSLKATLVKELTGRFANRSNAYERFNWIIARAKHYANQRGTTLDVILNEWEEERSYNWYSFYSNHNKPKLGTGTKPVGIRGVLKYYINNGNSRAEIKRKMCHYISQKNKAASTKVKQRWSSRKKRVHNRSL